MKNDHRIIEAFKSNGIKKILLIDDAYDPPELNEEIIDQLVDYLESEANKALCFERGITEDILENAISAANEVKYGNEELYKIYDVLYKEFVHELDNRFDLDGVFKLHKEPALQALKPLHNLLYSCVGNDKVHTAGLKDGMDYYQDFHPQVLFVDYYLSDDVPPTGDVNQRRRTNARKASIELLRQIIADTSEEEIPAIILMSSYKNLDVNKYRHDTASDKIMSLRFHFLNKKQVCQNDKDFTIQQAAVDALLDTSQGYHFGKVLQQALTQWKRGTESALSNFMSEVGELEVKDIAYLLRFKLREEGQQLSEYLQWFFGECLKGFIDKSVDWKHESFSSLDNEENLYESIEGSFEGATKKIAEFFHLVRVDSHRIGTHRGYQLGDLYVNSSGNKVRAIVTPDCDLIERKGKTKVQNVLTMGGALSTFNKDGSSADDFFLHKNKPYSVLWEPKDLEMYPIRGKGELHGGGEFDFLGTLRPLYALEMQQRIIEDLSRVGLPVAPALGINAAFTVWIRKSNTETSFHKININQDSRATLIPARSGQGAKHLVLLTRRFCNRLIHELNQIQGK